MNSKVEEEISGNIKDVISSIGKILEENKMTMTALLTTSTRVDKKTLAKARGVIAFGNQDTSFDKMIRELVVDSAKIVSDEEKDDDDIIDCTEALSVAIIKNPLLFAIIYNKINNLRKTKSEVITAAQAVLNFVTGENNAVDSLKEFKEAEEPEDELTH